jgi:hypothetical protein
MRRPWRSIVSVCARRSSTPAGITPTSDGRLISVLFDDREEVVEQALLGA